MNTINVRVHPRARQQHLEKLSSGEYKIHVTSPPVKGEANKEVIEMVAAHFNLPPSRVRIVRGLKSRQKLVALDR